MKKFDKIALLFLILGGINWLFYGFFRLNIVEYVFDREWVNRVAYVIFGLAAVYHLLILKPSRKKKKANR